MHDAVIECELPAFNDEADIDRVVVQARDYDLVGPSICFQIRAVELLRLAARLRAGCSWR